MMSHNSTVAEMQIYGSTIRYWLYNPDRQRTIVMLHGFSGNHLGFKELIKSLGDFRLIIPDLPGFGVSTPMTERPHTVPGYADCMIAFLRKLQLAQPPVLLGHSLGSVVAARLAAEAPKLTADDLLLISPTSTPPMSELSGRRLGAHLGESHYWLGVHLPKNLGSNWVKSPAISRATSALLTKSKDKKIRRAISIHHLNDLNFLQHKQVFYQAYKSLNREGINTYAPRITKRTLLVAGQRDEMWPAHTQRQLARLFASAELVLLPGIGHLTHFEAPRAIAMHIQDFIGRPV